MKKTIVLSFLAGLLLLSACSSSDETQYKPVFAFSYLVVYPQFGLTPDTIDFHADAAAQCYVIDSIDTADTLAFTVGLIGYGNMLTAFSANWKTADLSLALTDTLSLKQVLTPASSIKQCQLYFWSGFTALPVSMRLVPQLTGPSHTDFRLTVVSDSKYSPSDITFRLPVR